MGDISILFKLDIILEFNLIVVNTMSKMMNKSSPGKEGSMEEPNQENISDFMYPNHFPN